MYTMTYDRPHRRGLFCLIVSTAEHIIRYPYREVFPTYAGRLKGHSSLDNVLTNRAIDTTQTIIEKEGGNKG